MSYNYLIVKTSINCINLFEDFDNSFNEVLSKEETILLWGETRTNKNGTYFCGMFKLETLLKGNYEENKLIEIFEEYIKKAIEKHIEYIKTYIPNYIKSLENDSETCEIDIDITKSCYNNLIKKTTEEIFNRIFTSFEYTSFEIEEIFPEED